MFCFFSQNISETVIDIEQVAQLSQRNRAAGCVSFEWVVSDGVCQKTLSVPESLIFYTINPTFVQKLPLCVVEPLFGWGA